MQVADNSLNSKFSIGEQSSDAQQTHWTNKFKDDDFKCFSRFCGIYS